MKRRAFCAGAAGALVAGPFAQRAARSAASGAFSFALIGDTPYNALDERQLARVLASIDESTAFVIHLGDLMSSWEHCGDATLAARAALLAASHRPLVYTPGDNEWVDCASARAGGFDPRERLERLRTLFFSSRFQLPGASESADQRPDRPENLRWVMGSALFTTVNVPGSDNGEDERALRDGHNAARNAANEKWLREAFAIAHARSLAAIVIAMHANPRFERDRDPPPDVRTGVRPARAAADAYLELRALLRELATNFAGQVLLAHGDTHRFRFDRPLRDALGAPVPNVQRVECFGFPFTTSWVQVGVNASLAQPFEVSVRQLP